MDQFELEKMRWAPRSQPLKGPMRLFRFCLLGIFFPILLLCIPLYMRFISLRPHIFTLSPTDMKLLNYEHKVSTMWCKAQTLRMNSSFNAYLLPEKPKLKRKRQRIQMERKIIDLEDDMKEYWGFYLLADSYFRLQACSRHEGASVVIIKHSKNVERCAWLGELDSAEESDEISNEFDFQQHVLHGDKEDENKDGNVIDKSDEEIEELGEILLAEGSHEMLKYLNNIEKWSENSRKTIVKKLLEQIVGLKPGDKIVDDALKEFNKNNDIKDTTEVKHDLEGNTEIPDYRLSNLRGKFPSRDPDKDYDAKVTKGSEKNDAGEVEVDHFFHNGKFNQKNTAQNKEDKSNEETRSSWSSSEEALAACEGALFNIPLDGATKCNENATFDEMRSIMSNVSYIADSTGFYYFIFSNENEITSNFVAANFDMHKTVFDVANTKEQCSNTTDCSLPLTFMSHEHVVLEVPQSGSESCEYETEGFTNYQQCNTIVRAESICEPRGSIYMIFLLLVPVFILIFAYV
eukprot:GFUD01041300.1.p1 GENE.GFUD01041300.1~~GFUD01041300.1.p1  ORF type:complete len:517 (-),score=125.30 GFUD01041300.1:18-1568(-)